MAITVTHNKIATLPDEPGAEVNKAEWNDNHNVVGAQDTNQAIFNTEPISPLVNEQFSGGYENHPYIRLVNKPRFKFKNQEIPETVIKIIDDLSKKDSLYLDLDLELALRLRLKQQDITYKFLYLLLLQKKYSDISDSARRKENDAIEFLLLH